MRKEQLQVVVGTFSEQKAVRLSRLFAKNDTWQVPTLLVQYTYAFVNPYELRDSSAIRYVPAGTVNGWIERLRSFRKTRDERDMEAQKRGYQLEIQVVQMMRRSGVRFMIGTDAETFYPAGFGLHTELGLFRSTGFSSLETLRAATLNPSLYFGKAADLGTVEVGKLADLVILEANPLDDIRNTERIAGVVTAGRYLDRQELDQLLVAQYIATQRERYASGAIPLSAQQRAAMDGFFSPQLIDGTRLLVLKGERVANPDFYRMLRNLGFNNLPDQSAMAAITFCDVVVSHEPFSNGLLLHELVHVEQYRQLGIPRFSELYVRGFLDGGGYEAIPLEVSAYALGGRFEQNPADRFSVADEVRRWIAEGRF
jgi:hypothetical protein